ncbi:efflux RND transporter periplasmic adaptor subunit [Streptomyces sp. NBRC 110611]|uniref:efflux RND transporter periplasmic adaptor subunit n=1 Tax=Streptomyces sp. NBRC 110611 TaxID=1621259 RepID=UPI0008297F78|nr:efflux RND transporter periplasmic adaptor subunit [Streptomyces sp. NBRC 110611]
MFTYSHGDRAVTARLPLADQQLAKKGSAVRVVLPGGEAVQGRIADVRTVTGDKAGDKAGGAADTKPKTEVEVRIAVRDQKALGELENVTVDAEFTSEVRKDVFHVPVTALVARTGGGYGVEVPEGGGRTRLVPVKLGMFSNGEVEVAGEGLRAGLKVTVPR